MVDYNLLNSLGDIDAEVNAAVATALGEAATDLNKLVKGDEVQDFVPGISSRAKSPAMPGTTS